MLTGYRYHVQLAAHEYSGSSKLPDGTWVSRDNMREAAREIFEEYPDLDNLAVTVNEHGGWQLTFLRDGTIVGTANDSAIPSREARAYFERIAAEGIEWKHLGSRTRPELRAPGFAMVA